MTIAGVLPTLDGADDDERGRAAGQGDDVLRQADVGSESAYENADDQGGQSVGQLGQMLGQVGQMAQQAGGPAQQLGQQAGQFGSMMQQAMQAAQGGGGSQGSGPVDSPAAVSRRPVRERAALAPLRRSRPETMRRGPRAVVRAAGVRAAGARRARTRGTGARRQGRSASARPRHRRSRTPWRRPGAGRRTANAETASQTQHVIARALRSLLTRTACKCQTERLGGTGMSSPCRRMSGRLTHPCRTTS